MFAALAGRVAVDWPWNPSIRAGPQASISTTHKKAAIAKSRMAGNTIGSFYSLQIGAAGCSPLTGDAANSLVHPEPADYRGRGVSRRLPAHAGVTGEPPRPAHSPSAILQDSSDRLRPPGRRSRKWLRQSQWLAAAARLRRRRLADWTEGPPGW